MATEPQPESFPVSPGMTAWLDGLRQVAGELREAVNSLEAVLSQTPVHVTVEHLQVDHLEFRIDGIDVDDLNGELNIGLTNSLRTGGGQQQQEQQKKQAEQQQQPQEKQPQPPRQGPKPPETQVLWPPKPKEDTSSNAEA